jgi:hypothetical protein
MHGTDRVGDRAGNPPRCPACAAHTFWCDLFGAPTEFRPTRDESPPPAHKQVYSTPGSSRKRLNSDS